jgi:hypothetical protein
MNGIMMAIPHCIERLQIGQHRQSSSWSLRELIWRLEIIKGRRRRNWRTPGGKGMWGMPDSPAKKKKFVQIVLDLLTE